MVSDGHLYVSYFIFSSFLFFLCINNRLYLVYVPHTVEYTPAVQLSTLEYATVEIVNNIRVPYAGDDAPVAPDRQQPEEGNVVQQQLKFGRKTECILSQSDPIGVDPNKEYHLKERLLRENWLIKDNFIAATEVSQKPKLMVTIIFLHFFWTSPILNIPNSRTEHRSTKLFSQIVWIFFSKVWKKKNLNKKLLTVKFFWRFFFLVLFHPNSREICLTIFFYAVL